MSKRLKTIIFFSLPILLVFFVCCISTADNEEELTTTVKIEIVELVTIDYKPVDADPYITTEKLFIEEKNKVSDKDIELIALVTMAEAEGECEEGKRLVIDTILNRVDSEYFPDNVFDVVYQPHQFSSMWNGRVDRCEVREDICRLVREELECRMNNDAVFFTAGRYSNYGVPMFQIGNHYFSSYE